MGIEYQARIVVGLPGDELLELQEDYKWEEIGLSCHSYYDASYEDSIVGISVANTPGYGSVLLSIIELQDRVNKSMKDFLSLTGKEGNVYLVTHGW